MSSGPAETAAELAPWTVVDQYRVIRLLGRGGMGEVYLARDACLGRLVALKFLPRSAAGAPERAQLLIDEARAIAELNHPNIVTVYGVGRHEGRPYLALEYLEGVSLWQRARYERLSDREIVHVGKSVARALASAHAKGIVHRDLKPGNVLIGVDGRVTVLDFGIAKILAPGRSEGGAEAASPPAGVRRLVSGTPAYMAPEQWRGEESTPADVWALGVILFELATGRRPYLERAEDELARRICSSDPVPAIASFRELPPELATLIQRCLEKDPRRRVDAAGVVQGFDAMARRKKRRTNDEVDPFRGLLPFTERHADLFYGRDAEIAEFLERLRHGVVLPVVGPSGVGKSSFVRAGVIPKLQEQGSWLVIALRPLAQPLRSLASRLREAGAPVTTASDDATQPPEGSERSGSDAPSGDPGAHRDVEPGGGDSESADLAARLLRTPQLLAALLAGLAARTGGQILVFVDQLEELLTLGADGAERTAFVDALCSAAADPQEPIRVVMTLRDDFLGRIPWGRRTGEALRHVTILETPGQGALRQVIDGPLAHTGYAFEDDALPAEILAAFAEEAASLPLLQFALKELWDRRDTEARVLTRSAYVELGGVGGAVAAHADRVLAALGPPELGCARELLLRLVTPESTRRVVDSARLVEGLAPEAAEVLDRLVAARLLALHRRTAGDGGVDVELAHESLTSTWATLSRWLEENREERRALAELAEAADLWERRGRRRDQLWEGDALRDAERVLQRTSSPVTDVVRRFVDTALERRRRERRRRRGLVATLFALTALVAVAAGMAAWALAAREREALRGEARAEASRAAMLEEGARAALERREPLEAAAKLRSALEIRDSAALRVLWGDLLSRALSWRFPTNGIVYDVEFSPDGRWLAAANQSGLVYQVSVDGLEVRRLRVQGDQVLAVAFSPDGALLASSTWAGAVSLWDTRTGALRSRWSHEGAIPSMSFSHDGRLLAAASSRGGVYVTELGPRPSSAHVAPGLPDTRSVEFGPEGDLLVAAGSDRAVWLLHARGGDEVRRFDLGAPIDAAAFSPDGTLVAASAGGSVAVWPAGGGPAVKTFRAAAERIRDLDFSPDSRRLAVGGYDRVLSEWDLATGEQLLSDTAPQWFVLSVDYCPTDGRLAAARGKALEIVRAGRRGSRGAAKRIALHDSPVLQVAFSPDGARVATSGGGIRVWDVASGLPTASIDAPLKVRGLRFGREGATLIAALEDGAIETWDATTGASLGRFELGPSRRAQCLGGDESVGFAVGCASGEVLLVDPRSGRVERSAILHAGPVVGAALVPGERRAVTAGRDGKVMSWDLDSGASTVLLQHPVPLATVAVSSDGATVAVADEDGAIMFLDRASATVRSTLRLDGRVYRVEFLPDGRRIAAACSDGLAHVFDLESSAQTTLRGHRREVNWLAVSPDGTLLATVSDDTTLRLHRLADGHALWHGLGPIGPSALTWGHRGWRNARGAAAERPGEPWASLVEAARLTSQDAEGLCVVTIDDRLVRWDFGAGRPAFERPAARAERVVAGAGGCLTLRDGDAALTTPTIERSLTTGATAAARDGERLLLATAREVLIFDRDGRRIERLSAEPGVTALHRSGGLLALGFAEGTIVLRRAGSSERSRDELQDTPISGVAVMQEGPSHTLVAGFENGFVGLWDLSTRVLLSHLHLHGAVTGVAYADGGIVAATDLGDQGTIELGTLEQPYCELLREVRREVPFLWQGGVIADRDPTVPAACRPETSPAASRGIDRRGVEPKSRGSHRRGGHGAPRGGW